MSLLTPTVAVGVQEALPEKNSLRHWGVVLGRPAGALLSDGSDKTRLSVLAAFTEFKMGVSAKIIKNLQRHVSFLSSLSVHTPHKPQPQMRKIETERERVKTSVRFGRLRKPRPISSQAVYPACQGPNGLYGWKFELY